MKRWVFALFVLAAGCTQSEGGGVAGEIERQEAEVATRMADAKQLARNCLKLTEGGSKLQTTPSGLRWASLKAGDQSAPTPGPMDVVSVHYVGALMDGAVFDTSFRSGEPVRLNLNGFIQGWIEGLQLMHPGAQACLIIPPELGYGAVGTGSAIPPNATLAFYVEMLGLKRTQDGQGFGDLAP
jgi:FKBP-type peptidyl-prolyl cis-trans isomerase